MVLQPKYIHLNTTASDLIHLSFRDSLLSWIRFAFSCNFHVSAGMIPYFNTLYRIYQRLDISCIIQFYLCQLSQII
jgi:hypothetical protein